MYTSFEQLISHEQEYYELADLVEAALINRTGCSLPCSYTEYKMVGNPKSLGDTFGFGFTVSYAKTEVIEEKEVLLYEFISFVSEFGGALGLFLGFSFLTIWEEEIKMTLRRI